MSDLRITFTHVRPAIEASGPLEIGALIQLPPLSEIQPMRARRKVYKWIEAGNLERLPENKIGLGPRANESPRVLSERKRVGKDDVPTEHPENDTWIMWTQSGMVDTFTNEDVQWWLDLPSKESAWESIRAHIDHGWIRRVSHAVYARWDRGHSRGKES